MPTYEEILAALPELQRQRTRANRIRGAQSYFNNLQGQEGNGNMTARQQGGLYPTVQRWRPDYAKFGNQLVGALGGAYTGAKADQAEDEMVNARNAEIMGTIDQIGQIRNRKPGEAAPAGEPSEQTLRGYLALLGGPDAQTLLGKQTHVQSRYTDQDGNVVLVMSDGSEVPTGRKADYNVDKIIDPVTGQISVIGKSGAGRGVGSPVMMGQPPSAPPPAPATGASVPSAIPDMGGPKPVMDIPEVDKNVQAMLANGVAFMQSLGLPQEQQDAWVAEQIGKARTAQAYAHNPTAGPAPAAVAAGPAAQGGAPLRVSGAGEVEAAKIAAQNAAAAQTAQAEGLKTEERNLAEQRVALRQSLPKAKALAASMSNAIRKLKEAPGLDSIVGGSVMGMIPNEGRTATVARGAQSFLDPAGANAMALYDNIVGKNYAQAFETLKGSGPVTEKETERVANAYAALQRSQTKAQFLRNLQELDDAVQAGYRRMEEVAASMGAPAAPVAPANNRPALPTGFEWGD